MIGPIRCFSCGKPLGQYYEDYKKRIEKGENPKDVLDSMGIERYCCRRMILSHKELLDDIIKYQYP